MLGWGPFKHRPHLYSQCPDDLHTGAFYNKWGTVFDLTEGNLNQNRLCVGVCTRFGADRGLVVGLASVRRCLALLALSLQSMSNSLRELIWLERATDMFVG